MSYRNRIASLPLIALAHVALLAGAVQGRANTHVGLSDSDVCPHDDIVLTISYCEAPDVVDLHLTITPLTGSPPPSLDVIESDSALEGTYWVLRAGPNSGTVKVDVDITMASETRKFESLVTIGGGASSSSCASCGQGGNAGSLGYETVSLDGDAPYIEFPIGYQRRHEGLDPMPVRFVIPGLPSPNDSFGLDELLIAHPMQAIGDGDANLYVKDCRGGSTAIKIVVLADDDLLTGDEGIGTTTFGVVRDQGDGDYDIELYETPYEPAFYSTYECGSLPVSGTMIVKWEIREITDGFSVTRKRIEGQNEIEEITHSFKQGANGLDWDWITSLGATDYRKTSVSWAYDSGSELWTRTEITYWADSVGAWYEVSKRLTFHGDDGGIPVRAWDSEITDPSSGAPMQTTLIYYDSGVFNGWVKSRENPDGSWEWYEYAEDTQWRDVTRYHGWLNEALPGDTQDQDTLELVEYERLDDSFTKRLTPALRQSTIDGTIVSRQTATADVVGGYDHYETREDFSSYDAATQTGESLKTVKLITSPVGDDPPRSAADLVVGREVPPSGAWDGLRTFTGTSFLKNTGYARYVFSNGVPTFPAQDAPAYHMDFATEMLDASEVGYRVRLLDSSNQVVFVGAARHVQYPGAPSLWSDTTWTEWSAYEYDARGRRVAAYHSNGTESHTVWNDCCQSRVETDANGVSTRYEYDPIGRLLNVVRETTGGNRAITQYDYAGVSYGGRTLPAVTTHAGYDGAAFGDPVGTITVETANRTIRDLAGRVVAEQSLDPDASYSVALETTYTYEFPGTGGRKVTTTRPDGNTEVREYYRDGQLRSVTGTGVAVPLYYAYAINSADGSKTVTEYQDALNGPRFVARTYDMLGRLVEEERPAPPNSGATKVQSAYEYYGSTGEADAGRLKQVSHLEDGSPTTLNPMLYEYDLAYAAGVLSRTERTGFDAAGLTENGELVAGSRDRFTETTRCRDDNGTLFWDVSETVTYDTDNSDTPTVLSTRRELVGGFDSLGLTYTVGDVIAHSETTDERGNTTSETVTLQSGTPSTRHVYRKHSDFDAVTHEVWQYGLLVSSTSRTGAEMTYAYDGLGRQTLALRGDSDLSDHYSTTETAYDSLGRVSTVSDAASNTTTYTYYGTGVDGAGQVMSIENAGGEYTYFKYDDAGRLTHTWGDVPQPTKVEYTTYGERWKLHTYRDDTVDWSATTWPGDSANSDVTTWAYDAASGVLLSKTYADANGTSYTYTADGRLHERLWARGGGTPVTTTYTYDADLGDLTNIDYNDATYDVEFTYDRRGRTKTATQWESPGNAFLTYTYTHSPYDEQTGDSSVAIAASGLFAKTLTQTYNVGDQVNSLVINPDYTATYTYDTTPTTGTGRLARVTGPGLPGGASGPYGANYAYIDHTDLVDTIAIKTGDGAMQVQHTRAYESNRDLIDYVETTWHRVPQGTPPIVLAKYDYANDALGRRTGVEYTGVAFGTPDPAITQSFGYNDRNELTGSGRDNDGDQSDDLTWGYTYDPIGNRETVTENGSDTWEYVANSLNQYTQTDLTTAATPNKASFEFDADGNLTNSWAAADMNCDGALTASDIDPFVIAVTQGQAAYEAQFPNCEYMNADINGDGLVTSADLGVFVNMITSGNGNAALAMSYTWDAENRLISAAPTFAQSGDARVSFAYDYLGRRVLKVVEQYDGSTWTETARRKFIWSGWLMLMELDGLDSDAVVRSYTWGLDLAGLNGQVNSLEMAGGIGGLLAAYDTRGTPVTYDDLDDVAFAYDANGNVTNVFRWSALSAQAATIAHYEYDPYGNVLNDLSGQVYAAENPWRFSTKPFDAETGLGYWGYRYYSPTLGRWMSRDPIGEDGGLNTYGYVANAAMSSVDGVGLQVPVPQPVGLEPAGFPPLRLVYPPRPVPIPPVAIGAGCAAVATFGPFVCALGAPRDSGLQPVPKPFHVTQFQPYIAAPGYSKKRCRAIHDNYHNVCDQERSCQRLEGTDAASCAELLRRFRINKRCYELRDEHLSNCFGTTSGIIPPTWTWGQFLKKQANLVEQLTNVRFVMQGCYRKLRDALDSGACNQCSNETGNDIVDALVDNEDALGY
jgi:RHS repeat-associated protein